MTFGNASVERQIELQIHICFICKHCSATNAKDQSIALAAILFTTVPPSRKIHWPAELSQKKFTIQ